MEIRYNISTKELDNVHYAVVVLHQVEKYCKNENVILDKTMRFYLNMLKGQIRKIEEHYKEYIRNDSKIINRVKSQLHKAIYTVAEDTRGEKIALTKEDEELISIVDTIIYKYEEAVAKSKTIPKEVKTMMKKCCSYWYGFEKYILRGVK